MGMMFVYWAFKTVYDAPKSVPPQYRHYQDQEYRRHLLEEMGKQRQLRQRNRGECALPGLRLDAPLFALWL